MKTKIFALAACALLASLSAATASAAVKWHPGHYVMIPGGASLTEINRFIKQVGNDKPIKGIQVRIWWHELEPSKGVYNFSKIDALLKTLKAQPTRKQLVVRIMDRRFGTSSKSNIVPDYLRTSTYNGGLAKTRRGFTARIWEQNVMDRLIALFKAVGKRYDGDSYFEGISTEETTLGFGSDEPSGFTSAKLVTQQQRLIRAVAPVMPNTNLFLYTNWTGKNSEMETLFQTIRAVPIAAGGSNVIPGSLTQAQKVWTGKTGSDYRGRIAIGSSVEQAELGGNKGDFTPKQINDFAYNTLRANYMFWERLTWSGDSTQRWDTGILPFLRTNPPTRTGCPTEYGSCAR